MIKTGLTFAGGGGKGAYQIGAWKAFKEFGVDKNIAAVSGTSVGGLNGALFVSGEFEQGLKVWEDMSPEKILQINPSKIISALSKLNLHANLLATIGSKLGFLKSEGIFTQKGLEYIVRDSLNEESFGDRIPFYICATDVSDKLSWKPIYKKLNHLSYEDSISYLLATSAIPIAFPTTIIDEIELLDGFLTDNIPVKPLIEIEGCNNVIVVLLGRSESFVAIEKEYPDVRFWKIVPSLDTGEMLGSLNFSNENAQRLIDMGYQDTIKILQEMYEFGVIEQNYIDKSTLLQKQEKSFINLADESKELNNSYNDSIKEYQNISSLSTLSSRPMEKLSLSENYDIVDKQLIDTQLDIVLDDMQGNSAKMTKFAFDSITSLSTTDGRINYQIEQGHFSSFLGGISGKNHNIQTEINSDFSKSIYANQQMIKKLAERNNLTLDVCIVLGNRVNYLIQGQNRLQKQNIEQIQMLGELKSAIFTLAELSKNAIENNTKRIEKLEYGQELLNWSHHLKGNLIGLNEYEKIMKVVSTYHEIAFDKGEDNSQFLYSSLINCDLDKITINVGSFIEYVLSTHHKNNLTLFEPIDSSNFFPISKQYETTLPVLSMINKIYDDNKVTFGTLTSYFNESYGLDFDIDISGVDFAFELFNGLKISREMKNSLLISKNNMLNRLDSLMSILKSDKLDIFDKDIQILKKKIENFEVIVPVIGKFSSGKSRLLNSYISTNDKLFKVDTNPTTAIAGEIRYGKDNSIILYDKHNVATKISLDGLKDTNIENMRYLQYYLNYPKLKHREKLVLVDMPGFESSNLNHNDAINRYFNKGSHYILCLNCETANDNSILKHIKEILSYGAKFSVVITKSDKKLDSDIKAIAEVVKENISNKYPDEKFFIGITSSARNKLDDFEKIIDNIYEDAPIIFQQKFYKILNTLISNTMTNYAKLLQTPNNLTELEVQIEKDKEIFENKVSNLCLKLKEIEFDIISNGCDMLVTNSTDILDTNLSTLVHATKNNNLQQQTIELLRGPLNSTFQQIIKDSLSKLENDSLYLSSDLDLSLQVHNINTSLSFWGHIKEFLFDSQTKEIENRLKDEVIPNIISDMSNKLTIDLEKIYENIKQLVEKHIEEDKRQSEDRTLKIKEQILLQTDDFKRLQNSYKNSLNSVKKLKDNTWD